MSLIVDLPTLVMVVTKRKPALSFFKRKMGLGTLQQRPCVHRVPSDCVEYCENLDGT